MFTQHYTNPWTMIPTDVATIAAAKKTLDIAAYTLTEPTIIAAIVARAAAGVTVRVYLDRSELESEARGNPALPNCPLRDLMNVPNITVKVKASTILMHLKSYLVDGAMLRDGSTNFSPIGETEQDNSLTLTDDATAVGLFAAKYVAMWSRADNMGMEQAIESGASYKAHRQQTL
jgi:phosphatidylserine/phosphatidylglycerophosphate/cardiolipin synthase-like enzyme